VFGLFGGEVFGSLAENGDFHWPRAVPKTCRFQGLTAAAFQVLMLRANELADCQLGG
jgi:hypothetical protein